jgi:predicted benzoate:H+ symporter BenE
MCAILSLLYGALDEFYKPERLMQKFLSGFKLFFVSIPTGNVVIWQAAHEMNLSQGQASDFIKL